MRVSESGSQSVRRGVSESSNIFSSGKSEVGNVPGVIEKFVSFSDTEKSTDFK